MKSIHPLLVAAGLYIGALGSGIPESFSAREHQIFMVTYVMDNKDVTAFYDIEMDGTIDAAAKFAIISGSKDSVSAKDFAHTLFYDADLKKGLEIMLEDTSGDGIFDKIYTLPDSAAYVVEITDK